MRRNIRSVRRGAASLALAVTVTLLAGCGVSAGDGASDAVTATTGSTTSTSSPVLPGLDAIPGDRLSPDDPTDDDGAETDNRDDDVLRDDGWEERHRVAVEAYVDLCETDDRACDVLFLITDEGTDEEEVGASCGGRRPGTEEFCTPGIALDDDWFAAADDPAVVDLADGCRAGDGVACDLLSLVLREGDPLAELGFTCNDRFPDGPEVSCATDL